jgi:hypothetical protein
MIIKIKWIIAANRNRSKHSKVNNNSLKWIKITAMGKKKATSRINKIFNNKSSYNSNSFNSNNFNKCNSSHNMQISLIKFKTNKCISNSKTSSSMPITLANSISLWWGRIKWLEHQRNLLTKIIKWKIWETLITVTLLKIHQQTVAAVEGVTAFYFDLNMRYINSIQ